MGFLSGKKALITGIASNRSIAFGIAEVMAREGCKLALTYHNEKLRARAQKYAKSFSADMVLACDLSSDEEIANAFDSLKSSWGEVDIIVHSVAFAPRNALEGDYLDVTTRAHFISAHDISSYTFSALAKAAKERDMLKEASALLTVSYLGAVRAVPNYNVMGLAKASLEANVRYMAASLGEMGVRVNAVSAGPIKTLAASGIKDFSKLLHYAKNRSALKRNISIYEVGNVGAFLCSDLASGVTGEIVYVDAGYHFCEYALLD